MCRILAYLGDPLPVQHLLFDTDNGLVQQSHSPRMMNKFLNLAGFGMKAWDPASLHPEDPFTYHATTLPSYDRNLRSIASKLASTCLVAHVRGVTYSGESVVADTNLHPFHFAGARVVLAHNGHLRQFARIAAAQLQGQGMLLLTVFEQPQLPAAHQRRTGHHLGIQARPRRQQTVEIAAVAVGPVHHRGDADAPVGDVEGRGSGIHLYMVPENGAAVAFPPWSYRGCDSQGPAFRRRFDTGLLGAM